VRAAAARRRLMSMPSWSPKVGAKFATSVSKLNNKLQDGS
jgi:hypothetical protein